MDWKRGWLIAVSLCAGGWAGEDEPSRTDALPAENLEDASDTYLEGYIQALVDMHFCEYRVIVTVTNHNVYLSNLPRNDLIRNSIISFVRELPGVKSVEGQEVTKARERLEVQPRVKGVWFPQSTVLFLPLIAAPREPMYSVAYRGGDRVVGTQAVAISLGDDFPIFRWRDIMCWHGDMQIGIQGAVWAVFNYHDIPNRQKGETCELVNQDYMLAIPLTYAFDRYAFRLRPYHISGHLGDEFIVNHPQYLYKRKNPSFEAIDFITSYQFSSGLRGYFGPGIIVHSDRSFGMKTFYIMYGMELRIFGKKFQYHQLYGTPFLAIHLENWQQHHWSLDSFFKMGYELSKLQGIGRKMRVYVDYHQGYSYEGQFFNERTKYGEAGISWGW